MAEGRPRRLGHFAGRGHRHGSELLLLAGRRGVRDGVVGIVLLVGRVVADAAVPAAAVAELAARLGAPAIGLVETRLGAVARSSGHAVGIVVGPVALAHVNPLQREAGSVNMYI